jgi:glucose/arabinose dehydrogenase
VLAPGFSAEALIDGLEMPTAMRFAPDGRIFVAEKRGTIKVFSTFASAPVTVADLKPEVFDYWDHGLLDIAVNPEFPAKPYLYALYTLDGKSGDSLAAGTVPRYGDTCTSPTGSCPVVSRLDRIVVNPTTGVLVSRTTLIENWGNQYQSHGIGNLQWAPDGQLYISCGEGASFSAVDYGNGGNPLGDPPNATGSLTPPTAQGGALRSQVITPPVANPPFPTWFSGKVIKVNPETMTPMLDPKAVPTPSPVVASGLRNPFRMALRGGTNELWVGDVGWDSWEEIDRIQNVTAAAPVNFGWPCYEGDARQGGYEGAGLTICQNLYNAPGSVTAPHYAYAHGLNVVPGDGCGSGGASITGLAFYDATAFPAAYQGGLFFSDYARQCTWFLPAGANGLPNASAPQLFARGAGAPVQLTVGPDGDLYYVDIQGSLGRFHYTVNNHSPVAALSASANSGLPPFSVTFDASASTDADPGDVLSFAWDLDGDGAFDDGAGSVISHVYTTAQNVTVKVRVTDQKGAASVASTLITSGSAPVPTIQLLAGANWAVGDTITAAGTASDAEDGMLGATAFEWSIILQHCPFGQACHAHVLEDLADLPQVSLVGPDHDYPAHVDIVLTATDSDGLSASTTLSLDPATSNVTLNTVPAGMKVALNQNAGAAPQSMTVIRAATTTVSAPDQTVNGTLYRLGSWSDGGAATHALQPSQANLTLTATFVATSVGQNLTAGGTPIALITDPLGSGSHDLGVIKDGIKPAVGSQNSLQQYDTYTGDVARTTDWIGYTFPTTKQFTKVVFQEGQNFGDGGAFDTLAVQTRAGGVWSNVAGLTATPAYSSLNGINFETFELTFDPQAGDAIRIFGTASGSAHFISVAELEVYGADAIPGNAPPTANAGADQSVNLNASVTLSGSGSDPEGLPITYAWTQVSGPAVALSGAVTASPIFAAPAMAASLTFQLVTNDGAQNSAPDNVVVTVNDPNPPANANLTASGTPVAFITAPTGGGNKNLAIIKDGVKPAPGSFDSSQQYDTYNGGGARPNDWIGYTFTSAKLFNKLIFEEGMGFGDGGAFLSLGVQVRNAGTWSDVSGVVVTPSYAGLNGINYETYQLTFPGISGDGIRISGTPAGSAQFISIAELEVYGSDQAGPPPNLAPSANAGPDQTVNLSAAVTLSGSGSDPEGAAISYLWSQIGGPAVTLSSLTVAAPTFNAPATATTLTFRLLTNDGTQSSTADSVVITVSAPVNLKPLANAGPDQSVTTGALVTLGGSGSDPEGSPISYTWSQTAGPAVTLSSLTVAAPTFTAPASATSLTFQLLTNDGTQNSTADSVVITVSAPANLKPLANAGPDLSVNFNAAVTLSGSGSDPEGAAISYVWSQIGGPVVTLSSTSVASPTFTAPAVVTTLTFQLLTNDGTQNSTADSVLVTVNDPTPPSNVNITAGGTPVALITAPTGGGNKNLAIIKDGVKPAVGSTNGTQQYDTYNGGGARANDWIGYTFTSAKLFNKLVFQEGMNFGDGGAFTIGSLLVQVRNSGVWSNVGNLAITPTYPGLNTTHYETFTLTFNAISGDGIRIFGTPAGSARFVSIAELEVYGSNTAGPPPNLPPTANAGADSSVNINAAVTLSGSGSDPEGAAITYQWTQIGGAVVSVSGASTPTLTFTAPAMASTLTFQLVTNDGLQSGTADTVDVVVNDPSAVNLAASGTPVALITAPTGGGNKSLAIIKDGVKPAVGSNNGSQQYDTYNGGGARASDWVGYTFTTSKTFNRLVFVEGMQFLDGGAFTAGSLTVQVRNGNTWTNVSGLVVTPTYPGLNTTNYETFTLTFTAATGTGIRIFGTPAGSAHFISIAELEVYGN